MVKQSILAFKILKAVQINPLNQIVLVSTLISMLTLLIITYFDLHKVKELEIVIEIMALACGSLILDNTLYVGFTIFYSITIFFAKTFTILTGLQSYIIYLTIVLLLSAYLYVQWTQAKQQIWLNSVEDKIYSNQENGLLIFGLSIAGSLCSLAFQYYCSYLFNTEELLLLSQYTCLAMGSIVGYANFSSLEFVQNLPYLLKCVWLIMTVGLTILISIKGGDDPLLNCYNYYYCGFLLNKVKLFEDNKKQDLMDELQFYKLI